MKCTTLAARPARHASRSDTISEAVDRQSSSQQVERNRRGLESEHATLRPHRAGPRKREQPDMRPDVDERHAWSQQFVQQPARSRLKPLRPRIVKHEQQGRVGARHQHETVGGSHRHRGIVDFDRRANSERQLVQPCFDSVDSGGESDRMPIRVASERGERLPERLESPPDVVDLLPKTRLGLVNLLLKTRLGVVDFPLNVAEQSASKSPARPPEQVPQPAPGASGRR